MKSNITRIRKYISQSIHQLSAEILVGKQFQAAIRIRQVHGLPPRLSGSVVMMSR
ncbi:hypothetical protein IQ256_27055 [cf. Phormidesmis sp. LEGE 11477]|nr:hypothetical protein [cf. Phormidesmis sp. LEGE 11477]MBE9064613.1 hypothetical protein [cf. Phormidesmis sp. LEGE 11477]